jgi:hypothetical protein
VQNFVEVLKDVVKLNICEKKKRKQLIIAKRAKIALFSQRFVLNTLTTKQKELF